MSILDIIPTGLPTYIVRLVSATLGSIISDGICEISVIGREYPAMPMTYDGKTEYLTQTNLFKGMFVAESTAVAIETADNLFAGEFKNPLNDLSHITSKAFIGAALAEALRSFAPYDGYLTKHLITGFAFTIADEIVGYNHAHIDSAVDYATAHLTKLIGAVQVDTGVIS